MSFFPVHRSLLFIEEKPDKENNKPSKWIHDPVNLTSIEDVKLQMAGNDPAQSKHITYIRPRISVIIAKRNL